MPNSQHKECAYCNKDFEKPYSCSQKSWIKQKFCSRLCKHESGRVEKTCIICSKNFKTKKALVQIVCCSPECRKKRKSIIAKERIASGSLPILQANTEASRKVSDSLKLAYKEGRMGYMTKIWKEGSKRWSGKKNPRYKDGQGNGYKMIRIGKKWIEEHRYIFAQFLKRKLESNEIVHHINGNKHDNRLCNLKLMSVSDHIKLHRHSEITIS